MSGYLNVVGVSDNIEWLKLVPSNSVDAGVTDAPYGLGDPPPILAVILAWARQADYHPDGAGFMGKKWDAFVPNPSLWREVLRVLKPGAWLLAFFGSRTMDIGTLAIRIAGFEVCDTVAWLYGQGMPHGLDIAKALEAEGRSAEAARWKGWNTTLKPAFEPIVVARKPLDGTYVENILEHGAGALNIDGARIATGDNRARFNNARTHGTSYVVQREAGFIDPGGDGRYPANVLLAHDPRCVRVGTKKVRGGTGTAGGRMAGKSSQVYRQYKGSPRAGERIGYVDEDGMEEVEDWTCVDTCPIRLLDEQSGTLKSGNLLPGHRQGHGNTVKMGNGGVIAKSYGGDSGGASRFFYTAKAGARERWSYCRECKVVFQHSADDAFEEHDAHKDKITSHPTQKPLDLMDYLVRLVTPPGGTVVDPFCGTGSTPVACKQGGFNFVTCDIEPDYAKIAEARLASTGLGATAKVGASYFCPGCKAKGEIKLIERAVVERMKADGKKVTCSKCMKRYSYEELESA